MAAHGHIVWLRAPVPESVAKPARDREVVVTIGERPLSKTTAVLAAMMTDVHKDLATIADDETEMSETTDDAADQETHTPAAANLECHAVPKDAPTATAKPLAHALEAHTEPANGPQLAVVAITRAREVPTTSTGTYLGAAKSAMTAATANAQTAANANAMTAVTESEATAAIATASAIQAVLAAATTAETVRATTGPASTIAGTQETAARERVATPEAPERLQSATAASRTRIATFPATLAATTKTPTVKGSGIARIGRGVAVGVGAEIGIASVIETETRDVVVVDHGVEIVGAGDVVSRCVL